MARATLGLREIGKGWVLVDGASRIEESWAARPNQGNLSKKLRRGKSGALEWEEDYYYTGKTFQTIDGTSWELLIVHFDYRTTKVGVDYIGDEGSIRSVVEQAAEKENSQLLNLADEILAKWGIPRK